MVWRFFLRYFANNEQVVERLSQSNFMRRAAQLTVYSLLKWRGSSFHGSKSLSDVWKSISSAGGADQQCTGSSFNKFDSLSKRISEEMKAGVKEFQDEMRRRNKPS